MIKNTNFLKPSHLTLTPLTIDISNCELCKDHIVEVCNIEGLRHQAERIQRLEKYVL